MAASSSSVATSPTPRSADGPAKPTRERTIQYYLGFPSLVCYELANRKGEILMICTFILCLVFLDATVSCAHSYFENACHFTTAGPLSTPNVECATRKLGRDALCFKGLPVIVPGREQCWVDFNLELRIAYSLGTDSSQRTNQRRLARMSNDNVSTRKLAPNPTYCTSGRPVVNQRRQV